MPRLTRWYLRAGLLHLIVGLGLTAAGGLSLLRPFGWALTSAGPAALHLLVVGWVTQVIFGVVWWMFPRHTKAAPYGSVRLGWATFACLNTGLILRLVAEPALGAADAAWHSGAVVVSALLQWAASICFAVNTWPRIKER